MKNRNSGDPHGGVALSEVDCKPLKKMRGNISWGRSHPLLELTTNRFDGIDGIHTPAAKGLNNNWDGLDAHSRAGFLNGCELSVFPHSQGISLCGYSSYDRLLLQWRDDSHIESSKLTLFPEWQKNISRPAG